MFEVEQENNSTFIIFLSFRCNFEMADAKKLRKSTLLGGRLNPLPKEEWAPTKPRRSPDEAPTRPHRG